MLATMLIYVFGALAIFSGLMMILYKNPIHSALWFGLVLFSLAGIYALLQAHFLALIQILVYVGAITVLIVYVIALLNFDQRDMIGRVTILKGIAVIISAILFIEMLFYVGGLYVRSVAPSQDFGKAANIGIATLTNYLFPFEVISILLLVAVIGGVYIAKKD